MKILIGLALVTGGIFICETPERPGVISIAMICGGILSFILGLGKVAR